MFNYPKIPSKSYLHLTLKKHGALIGIVFLMVTAMAGCVEPAPPVRNNPVATALAQGQATLSAQQTVFAQKQDIAPPVDYTRSTSITITVENPLSSHFPCLLVCFTPLHIKVKVGTTITWINKTRWGLAITAVLGEDLDPQNVRPASQIFSSGMINPLENGQTFTYKVTEGAYSANPDHRLFYYDMIHPGNFGELTIVA